MSGKECEKDLFDVVLIVELQEENGGKIVPFISYRYPQLFETDNFTSSVTQFCFPDINQFPTEEMNREIFSFVVTDGSGERRFGYCLRKLPPGQGLRFPTAYSVLSYFPCYSLYTTIIDKVAYHYENSSMSTLSNFLSSMLVHRFPAPGQSFTVKIQEAGQTKDFRFSRPDGADSQLEYVDVEPLLLELNPTNILTIFLSLLFERRIIFCASKLSILSSCVQTAVALLYPFTWQHIYIPVLPKSLLSFCCAPMPFVVGILASELNEVLTLPMDEVLIINIDTDSFIRTPGTNDLHQLPQNYIDPLKKVIKASSKVILKYYKKRREIRKLAQHEAEFQEKQLQYEVKKQKSELKETFLEFFVYLFGSLRKHIHNNKFDSEGFISSQPPEVRVFMELFIGSQMFEMFIQDRIHTKYTEDAFEKAVCHKEKLNSEFTRFFGEVVDGSLYKPNPITKKPTKQIMNSMFESLKKGIKTSLDKSAAYEGPISSPTLVQATNDRMIPSSPSQTPPNSPSLSPSSSAITTSAPPPLSPNSHPTTSHFTPPSKPMPHPLSKLSPPSNNNNNITEYNDQVVLRSRSKAPVRHIHSTALPNNKLSNSDSYPTPPPRISKSTGDGSHTLTTSSSVPNMHFMRGSAARGRVKQRPMSSRPTGEEFNEIANQVPGFSTLRSSKNQNRPLPKPPV